MPQNSLSVISRVSWVFLFLSIFLLSSCNEHQESNPKSTPKADRYSVFYVNINGARGTELRLYSPSNGDSLLLDIQGQYSPTDIFWTKNYTDLYYRIGSKYFRLPWKEGADPEIAVEFKDKWPVPSGMDEQTWFNENTKTWRLYSVQFAPDTSTGYVVQVYDYENKLNKWVQLLSHSTEMCEGGDGSACGAEAENFTKDKGKLIMLSHLLAEMRAAPNMKQYKTDVVGDPDNGTGTFMSPDIPGIGIQMKLGFGDTLHALPPVTWVDKKSGANKMIYSSADNKCLGQIAFELSGSWALIGEEYSLKCATLVNLRNGAVVHRFPKYTNNAVWVPNLR